MTASFSFSSMARVKLLPTMVMGIDLIRDRVTPLGVGVGLGLRLGLGLALGLGLGLGSA